MLKHLYGMTLEDWENLYDAQKGCCAICKRNPDKKRLSVDHDHATGKIRGLLCRSCNWLIGNAKDNQDVLHNAVVYLTVSAIGESWT